MAIYNQTEDLSFFVSGYPGNYISKGQDGLFPYVHVPMVIHHAATAWLTLKGVGDTWLVLVCVMGGTLNDPMD